MTPDEAETDRVLAEAYQRLVNGIFLRPEDIAALALDLHQDEAEAVPIRDDNARWPDDTQRTWEEWDAMTTALLAECKLEEP